LDLIVFGSFEGRENNEGFDSGGGESVRPGRRGMDEEGEREGGW